MVHPILSFSGGSVVKNPLNNARDVGSIPGSGRSPGGGSSNPLQHSCLCLFMDREAWWATVRGIPKSWAQFSNLTTTHAVVVLGGDGEGDCVQGPQEGTEDL